MRASPGCWSQKVPRGPEVLQVTVPKCHQENSRELLHPHPFWAAGAPPAKTLPPGMLLPSRAGRMGLSCPRRLRVAQPPNPSRILIRDFNL